MRIVEIDIHAAIAAKKTDAEWGWYGVSAKSKGGLKRSLNKTVGYTEARIYKAVNKFGDFLGWEAIVK